MKRGISFEIPNQYGSFLGKVLQPIDISELIWRVDNVESYFVIEDQLADELFSQELNGIDGISLRDYLENNRYYVIFTDLKGFPKGEIIKNVETYEEFVNSKCQLVLLVVDSIMIQEQDYLHGKSLNSILLIPVSM